MKVLAAVATLAMAAAIGAGAPQAAEKTARLYDPVKPGQERVSTPRVSEKDVRAPVPDRIGLSNVELERIRSAIRVHIRAVSAKKSVKLFETLTPVAKDHYGTSDRFLEALEKDLKPLASVREFAFGAIDREAEDALQSVILTDDTGREWQAEYRLQRQGDGNWAIHGCLVEPLIGSEA